MRQYPDFVFVKDRPLMPKKRRFWRLRTVKTTRFVLYERVGFTYYGQRLEMPWGFKSDFASIPRLLWWLIPPHGLAALPSVKHDYLYDERIGQKQ
ncbi:DUF1353 domain-containing protein, partial [Siphonobacter sp.]|uniref:DUF1353 domain-containing protein n=1 Tax=Siphonobacter sp. TaxID=1869184 RepID=UPI003B3B9F25